MLRTHKARWCLTVIVMLVAPVCSAVQPDHRGSVKTTPAIAGANELAKRNRRLNLHVATYNIEHGHRVPSASKEITAFLNGLKPDIVCLQEARWTQFADATASRASSGHPVAIADALGGYTWCGADRRQSNGATHSGMAIVTRGRILNHETLQIAHESPYGVLAEIEIDGIHLIVASVHLRSLNGATIRGALSTEAARVQQADHLVNRLKHVTLPVIVAGDFNALPIFPSYGSVARRLRDVALEMRDSSYTRETRSLPARIDYIFVSDHFAIDRYAVHPVDYSDHRPVTAQITLLRNEDSD